MRVVIFKGSCAYDAVNVSADALAVGLRGLGHDALRRRRRMCERWLRWWSGRCWVVITRRWTPSLWRVWATAAAASHTWTDRAGTLCEHLNSAWIGVFGLA